MNVRKYEADSFEEVSDRLDGVIVHPFKVLMQGFDRWLLHDFVAAARAVPVNQLRVGGGSLVLGAVLLVAVLGEAYQSMMRTGTWYWLSMMAVSAGEAGGEL